VSKDYCSYFPETIFGIYIGNSCKNHDSFCSTIGFYRELAEDLKALTFNREIAFLISFGGGVGCFFKYTSKMFRRI